MTNFNFAEETNKQELTAFDAIFNLDCISRTLRLERTCMCDETCLRVLVLPVLNLM